MVIMKDAERVGMDSTTTSLRNISKQGTKPEDKKSLPKQA
jgi:hypothetical protein